jgi:hypothetical protein
MIRGVLLFALLSVHPVFGSVQSLPALPNGTTASAVQVDGAGNIYVAGSLVPQTPKSTADITDAFAAKLSPDGSQVIWLTTLSGSSADSASALALGSDGSVYLTGDSQSTDFPTTQGSMQPALGNAAQAFAAKLSPAGVVVYATFLAVTGSRSMHRGIFMRPAHSRGPRGRSRRPRRERFRPSPPQIHPRPRAFSSAFLAISPARFSTSRKSIRQEPS